MLRPELQLEDDLLVPSLYREFRVGNAVTQVNPLLKPESVEGVELGLDLTGEGVRVGVTAFHNKVGDVVNKVTLLKSPAQIIRQRRNAAQAPRAAWRRKCGTAGSRGHRR